MKIKEFIREYWVAIAVSAATTLLSDFLLDKLLSLWLG